jgi:glycosyltransferase involved in cell wall biosynthesis
MTPTVSILMTAYNHEAFIRQAVESVLAQETAYPLEIVIGEDCSTDGTREVLEELWSQHPQAIRLLLRPENWGRRRNFMDALASCQGRYVAILEGDDYWTDSQKLQRQVELLEAHPEYALSFHPVLKRFEVSNRQKAFYPPGRQSEYTIHDLLERNFIATCSVLFRNRLIEGFPDWYLQVPAGDWPLHALNARHGAIAYLDQLMAVHRIHPGGVWSPKGAAQRTRAKIDVLETLHDHLGPDFSAATARGLRTLYLQLLWVHLRRRDLPGFLRALGDVRASDAAGLGDLVRGLPEAQRRRRARR